MLGNQHDTLFNYMYSKLLFLCPIILPSLIDKNKNEPIYGEWKSKSALIENSLPYFELYCKLILTSGDGIISEFEDKNDRFETQEIWIWLLRFISNDLIGSEYSTYLKLMLKECGTKLIKDYKIQGIKLLRYLQTESNNKPNQSIIKEIKDEIELLLTKNLDDKNTNISKLKDSSQQEVSEYTIKQTCVQEMQLEAANYQKGIHILKKLNQNIDSKIELKKKRFDIRKKIRPKLSQINNTRTVVMEVLNNIQAILNDAKLCHHSLYIWTLNFLVKQAIKQTETEIISNLSMAFPLAKLLLLLCKNNFELRNLLNIRFYKRCPYILPNTLPKYSEEIKPEIYKKRMGYIQKDNRFEELDVYIKRINAIFYLYCALLQFDEKDGINNTYGIDHAWLWLSRCLIVAPNEVSAELLNTFLIVCGGKLIVSYKTQAIKQIEYIEREYFPKLDLKLKATQFRLQITLEKMKENNYFIQFPIGRDFNGESNRSLLKTPYDSGNNNPFSFANKDNTTTQFSFTNTTNANNTQFSFINTKNENSNTQTSFGFIIIKRGNLI
ncbi:GLE1-domain-containing protein [Neoconidiobolus thromboides FSU 785]|nr:GLE1-domain-containing protein [Neoconidiobolus thromboides FSU 785]